MADAPLRQKDLARSAGVNPSTVSRALNNDPRIPAATRERIRRMAAELGYRPDPLLSALASYRRRGRGPLRPGMAYLRRARPARRPYRAYHADLLRGAQEYAALYGYTIDYLPYDRADDPALERVLRARGIRGLLIEPIEPEDALLELDWSRYAVVSVDNPFLSPRFDRVAFDAYGAAQEAFSQCLARGYARPGLAITEQADRNGERKTRAGYWIRMSEERWASPPPPLILADWDETGFRRWFEGNRVDAIITSQAFIPQLKAALAGWRRAVPQEVGILNTNVHTLPADASGFHHHNAAIGASAAELLIGKLARNEYGPSPHARVTSQQGRWVEGGTLRPPRH